MRTPVSMSLRQCWVTGKAMHRRCDNGTGSGSEEWNYNYTKASRQMHFSWSRPTLYHRMYDKAKVGRNAALLQQRLHRIVGRSLTQCCRVCHGPLIQRFNPSACVGSATFYGSIPPTTCPFRVALQSPRAWGSIPFLKIYLRRLCSGDVAFCLLVSTWPPT